MVQLRPMKKKQPHKNDTLIWGGDSDNRIGVKRSCSAAGATLNPISLDENIIHG